MDEQPMNYEELYKQVRSEFEQYKLKLWSKQQRRLPEIDIEAITEWLEDNAIAVVAGATLVGAGASLIKVLSDMFRRK